MNDWSNEDDASGAHAAPTPEPASAETPAAPQGQAASILVFAIAGILVAMGTVMAIFVGRVEVEEEMAAEQQQAIEAAENQRLIEEKRQLEQKLEMQQKEIERQQKQLEEKNQ